MQRGTRGNSQEDDNQPSQLGFTPNPPMDTD